MFNGKIRVWLNRIRGPIAKGTLNFVLYLLAAVYPPDEAAWIICVIAIDFGGPHYAELLANRPHQGKAGFRKESVRFKRGGSSARPMRLGRVGFRNPSLLNDA